MKAIFPVFLGAMSLVAAGAAAAHHSFAAEFDLNRPVKLTGSVARIEWTNPHAWVFIDVKRADGGTERWAIETVGGNALLRRGWTRDTVKVGDAISVEGFGARDGSNTGNASAITTSTGQRLYASERDEP